MIKKIYQKTILTLLATVASMSVVNTAYAREKWAQQLGVYPTCTGCHTSQDAGGFNAKPAAKDAYVKGGVIPGLRDFLASASNAKPVLQSIDNQWNVHVGEVALTIPLIVKDKESDSFVMQLANASSASAPKGYTLSKNSFVWKPTATQKNKNYTVKFVANETTASGAVQQSNTVSANIFVWPARAPSPKNVVSQFIVDSAKWNANKLTMTGRIVFKATATATAKATALKSLKLNLKSNANIVVGTPVVLKINTKGAWTTTFALTSARVPCLVKLSYEDLNAARSVNSAPATCVK